jgi:hypothetical protein
MDPMKKPWMKFYPADWRSDEALRSCSIAARGLWVEMMALMHVAEPVGSLLIKGKRPDKRQIASLSGISEKECVALMIELEGMAVFSRDADGTIYSRRMRRDAEKAIVDKENGSSGGNPKLKAGVNPHNKGSDKAQKLEARNQKEDSEANASGAEAPIDHRKRLFDEGLPKLARMTGKGPDSCRSFVAKCLKAASDDAVVVLGLIDDAERNQSVDPSGYIVSRLKGPQNGPAQPQSRVIQAADDLCERIASFDGPNRGGGLLRGGEGSPPPRLLSHR